LTTAPVTKLSPGRTIGGARIEKVGNKNPSLNILIYGDSGTGKTTLCGSADDVPQMRKVLIVDLEGGTESLRSGYPNVDVVRVSDWKQMQAVYDDLKRGGHGYETAIIDSLTECQKFNMYHIMKDLVDRKTAEEKYVDEDIASVREWGKNIEQMRKFVRAMRDLPIHTIFTALEQEKKDDKTGAVKVTPSLSGKLAGEVAAFLDVVMYYYVKEVASDDGENEIKRILLTRRTAKHTAKDRTGKLPTMIVDPTMKSLYELMYPATTK
jgi:phage nucleotide-binding protein